VNSPPRLIDPLDNARYLPTPCTVKQSVKQPPVTPHPFPKIPVPEIALPAAPLVRVVTQLRFAPIASITQMEFIAPFQEALRSSYPTMGQQRAVMLNFGPEGVSQTTGDRQWRLVNDQGTWTVVLAPSFVSLETTSYESRTDFVDRLTHVASALEATIGSVPIERLGVRYTDRLTGDDATTGLESLVRKEALGAAAFPLDGVQLRAAVSEAEFVLPDETQITARWGQLPADATLTPDLAPIDEPSWIMDIDVAASNVQLRSADVESVSRRLCEHAYNLFRWIVTDEFLRRYGGSV
jgi:uncharacterized protein (TIGR04255 family)